MLAKYKCLHCGYEWEEKPAMVSCIKCNPQMADGGKPTKKYVKWLNYEEMKKSNFK